MVRHCGKYLAIGLMLTAMASAANDSAPPIRLHPKNPRYFEWRGKAIALITSAEHYGAVLNLDFDWHRYLETLHRDGMNYTRIFSGSYVEPVGAFGIQRNTLAPASGNDSSPHGLTATNPVMRAEAISSISIGSARSILPV